MTIEQIYYLSVAVLALLLIAIVVVKGKKAKKKAWFTSFIVFLSAIFLVIGGAFYFQSARPAPLNKEEAKKITEAYYLIRDFESNLEKYQDTTDSAEKITALIAIITTKMSAFSHENASSERTEKESRLINQYYHDIGQIGVNAYAEKEKFAAKVELRKSYLSDLSELKKIEKELIDTYKIDEAQLQSNL